MRCLRMTSMNFLDVQALAALDEFQNLDRDIEGSAKRWKKFVEHETPEKEKFPQEWKNKSALQKLCMMRALRPDRMTYAVKCVLDTLVHQSSSKFANYLGILNNKQNYLSLVNH